MFLKNNLRLNCTIILLRALLYSLHLRGDSGQNMSSVPFACCKRRYETARTKATGRKATGNKQTNFPRKDIID